MQLGFLACLSRAGSDLDTNSCFEQNQPNSRSFFTTKSRVVALFLAYRRSEAPSLAVSFVQFEKFSTRNGYSEFSERGRESSQAGEGKVLNLLAQDWLNGHNPDS